MVDRAIEQCRASQGHLDASRHLLARSHRLLNRAWWIAGASDDNGDFRLKIRDRLLKGAKASDLPIERCRKMAVVFNLKAAHALGLTIDPTLTQGARVIE